MNIYYRLEQDLRSGRISGTNTVNPEVNISSIFWKVIEVNDCFPRDFEFNVSDLVWEEHLYVSEK